jgi:hypothetical protein
VSERREPHGLLAAAGDPQAGQEAWWTTSSIAATTVSGALRRIWVWLWGVAANMDTRYQSWRSRS